MEQEKVIKLEAELKDFYENFHAQCNLIDTYYNLKFPIPNIEGFTEYRPSTAQVAIDDAAAQIDISSLQVRVPYRSESKKNEATKLELFLNGCWYAVLRNDGTLLNRKSKSLFKDGVGIFKILCDTDAVPVDKEDGYRFDNFPFKVLLKHPTHVMVDPSYFSTGNFRYVIESYKRKAGDIRENYPQWESGKDINADVDWIEYWDDKEFLKIADKIVVDSGEHDYGSPPYEITDAGLGYEDKDGLPECRWRSLIHSSLFDLTFEARLLYQYEAILRIQAWPQDRYQVTDEALMDEKRAQEWVATLNASPMSKVVIPAGLTPLDPKPVALPPIFNILGVVQSKIDSATVAKVARGERPEGAASGYMTAILAGMARIKFGPAMNSLQSTIERINRRFLKNVETYYDEEGIAVWGKLDTEPFDITLRGKDIKGYYVNEVNLSSVAPEEESRRMQDGISLYGAGLCSRDYVRRHFLLMKNPQADTTQMMIERALDDPMLMQKLVMALSGSPEFMGQVTQGLQEAGMPVQEAMPNQLGNQGNPPAPSQSGPTPQTVMNQTPLQVGSNQEAELVARQNAGLSQKMLTGRI